MLALALCEMKINGVYYVFVVAMDYSSESAVKLVILKSRYLAVISENKCA
jgi:hypothetical protein